MPNFPIKYLDIEVSSEVIRKKRDQGICTKHGCQRVGQKKKGGICNTCASRIFRLKNDIHYAYSNLKNSAKKRSIQFDLTYAEFQEFCKKTNYHSYRGTDPASLTVNRIRSYEGYNINNIEPMRHDDNSSRKYDVAPYESPFES
jgi:hypothetical protein